MKKIFLLFFLFTINTSCTQKQPDDSPYYQDDNMIDLDCVDIGQEVWVGGDDPNYLDADGDGWGCEGW